MWKNNYENWINNKELDATLLAQLKDMNKDELFDAFYKNLTFGTGGIRGVLGPGTNRLNIYTIRKANLGFAKYLLDNNKDAKERGVVIAYDNRHFSQIFAYECSRVFAELGIKSYVFESLRPTPELSFAVRELKAIGGIVVTASHNPAEYNGYKIYDKDGCQLVPKYASKVVEEVEKITDLFSIAVADLEESISSGMVNVIGSEMDKLYIDKVLEVRLNPKVSKDFRIVFTPLHGTSQMIGYNTLVQAGYNVTPVKEQMVADPDFSTVVSPNPEDSTAFEYAIKLGKEIDAEILIATDPDSDRLGVAVKDLTGEYQLLTGNQTGAILIYYLLNNLKEQNLLPEKGMVYNTIVTSDLGAKIARSFGMGVFSTLTGFKFIGEQAKLIEDTDFEFVFGYEESYGYVIKDFVRDKDATQALLLASEATAYYKEQGLNLLDVLNNIYKEYGVYRESLKSIVLKGKEGSDKIAEIMSTFRNNSFSELCGAAVVCTEDYLTSLRVENKVGSVITLPKENVLKYKLDNGSWFVLRPSGTEPKLKVYVGVVGETVKDADLYNEFLMTAINDKINKIL